MTHFFLDDELIEDEPLAAYALSPDGIALDPAQLEWAVSLSQTAPTEAERWQTYLSTLALLGVQEWLQKRSPELRLHSDWLPGSGRPNSRPTPLPVNPLSPTPLGSTPLSPMPLSQQICCLRVGEFKLYLLLTDGLEDPLVTAPKAIVDLTDFAPDFYVLVEVLEELGEVRVYGYLPQLELARQSEIARLPQEDAQTVLLPISQFMADPDSLLFHLRYSDPAAFRPAAPVPQPSPLPAMNVGAWLRNRIDQVAAELSWVLLPPAALNLSGALMSLHSVRSPLEDLDAVVTELRRDQAVVIPPEARAAYRDLQLEAAAIRLYALTWMSLDQTEWSLLLILGAQPGAQLPQEIALRVEDDTQILIEESLSQAPYLYAQTIGTWDEQFRVTIALPNGASLTLPPFEFNPNAEP
jgi:Protein of unknown function (DUF1822)